MAELSSKAQATLSAYRFAPAHDCVALAAAIEALADQVVPEETDPDPIKAWSVEDWNHMNITRYQREETRRQILAIAAELRGQDQSTSMLHQMHDPCRTLDQSLRAEDGGQFGFVAIWRPGQDDDTVCRRGITVEQFLCQPENFGGTWLIDGGWGGPPGPVRVDWLDSESRWMSRGYSAGCRDPFLADPKSSQSPSDSNFNG